MKNAFRFLCIATLAGCTLMTVPSCSDDYDDSEIKDRLDKVEDRVTSLEEWCITANSEISSLKKLITALENNDYVTGVETLENGYKITFSKSGSITIQNGKDGADGEDGKDGLDGYTPVIGVAKHTDGFYYWTIQAEDGKTSWLTDADGNMIRTTGDDGKDGEDGADGSDGNNAPAPIMKAGSELDGDYIDDAVYLSVDGGTTWTKISGDKGVQGPQGPTGPQGPQGESIFKGIETNDNYIELTLNDEFETKIKLPRYSDFFIAFESDEIFYASPTENELTLVLPATFKESDYRSIIATVTPVEGADIQSRHTDDGWTVTVTKPSFTDETLIAGSAKVEITGNEDTKLSDTYMLRVVLIAKDGKEVAASRLVKYTTGTIATNTAELTDTDIKHLAWKGAMADEDFTWIKDNLKQLEVLDLTMAEATTVPEQGLKGISTLRKAWLGSSFETLSKEAFCYNENLEEIDLANVRTIEKWAFYGCSSLKAIDLPKVTTLGESVFGECTTLTTITLHEGLTTLSQGTFMGCGVATLEIPNTVTTIPENCFRACPNLQQVYFHNGITSIGKNAFLYARALERFVAPTSLTVIDESVFHACYNLKYVMLHDNITEIKKNAFYFCKELHCLINSDRTSDIAQDPWPKDLLTIGEHAFEDSGLEFIGLEDTQVETISKNAFYGCDKLKTVELSQSLETIQEDAFYGCSAMSLIRCYAPTAPALKSGAFGSVDKNKCILHYPKNSDYTSWGFKNSYPQL